MGERRAWPWIWVGALYAAASCTGGTDTGNPLTDFDISKCKSKSGEALADQRSALTLPAAERYHGLTCYLAERSEDSVALSVYNIAGGCGVDWDAKGRERAGELDVVLTNPSCTVARCGGCVYDAAFSLELGTSTDESVELIEHPCEGDPRTLGAWDVPQGDGATTLHCTFSRAAGEDASKLGLCGQENQPCRVGNGPCAIDPGAAASACDDGLSCTEVSEHDSRCLKQCSSDDDCAVPGALRCRDDGLCRL